MVPIMVYMLRMPMHVVVGHQSLSDLFYLYQCDRHAGHVQSYAWTLSWPSSSWSGLPAGAQIGARISKRLKGDQIKILLAVIILVVMVQMLLGLVLSPKLLLSYKGGH